MSKITIKVTKTAFYNGALVYPNEIIKNYKGDIPSWATLAGGKEQQRGDDTQKNKTPQPPVKPQTPVNPVEEPEENNGNKTPEEKTEEKEDANKGEEKGDEIPVNPEEKTEIQLQEELDTLLDESVTKGIILENAENKTIVEQIAELKTLLGKE